MKEIVQKIFGLFGLRLIRSKYARKYIPKACVDNVEIIVKFYSLMNRKINLLQVGACDGVTSDSIYKYIKNNQINAFLVEPSSVNFGKLKEFYSGDKNSTLINAAVATTDGQRTLYTIKDEGRWKDSGWARQLASFYKEHLYRHGILENEILGENVECVTLKTIVEKYGISDLDVLLIDTEGYDGEIVKMALSQKVTPNFIAFESGQLVKIYSQQELDHLYNQLAANNYVWTHDRINTLAIKKDFFAL